MQGNDLIAGCRTDCLIVLGMHRSGTSTLAECLHLLGLNPGETLMGGNVANPSGYFENQDVVLAHDILLRDLGCRWDMVGNLPSDWLESEAAEKARQTLTGIVKRQFLERGPWFLKDPRLCRLMPLWRQVLESLDIQPSFVLMLRHPLEAARSLEKRDGFDLLKGHLLWLVHNREALQACRDHNHIIVTFDQLMADPLGTLGRIGVALPGLQFDLARHRHEIMEFVCPELKHHHQGDESGPDERFAPYAWLYEQFRHLQARAWTPLEGGAGSDMQRLALEEGQLAEFPLVPVASPLAPPGQVQGVAVFGDLLAVIGRYEQAERDHHLQRERQILASLRASSVLYLQIFFPGPGEPRYVEERSRKILLAPDEWQQVTVDVPRPEVLRAGRLRLDPINAQGMVSISAVNLVNPATGQVCWSARASEEFKALGVQGDGFALASDSGFAMVSTGSDPQLLLPRLPDLPDVPLHLEVWIKISRRQSILRDHLAALTQERDQAREQGQAQARQLEAVTRERDQAREQGQAQARQLEQDWAAQAEKIRNNTLKTVEAQKQNQLRQLKAENQRLHQLVYQLNDNFQALTASWRWKVGNSVVRGVEMLLLRSRVRLATDQMRTLFEDYVGSVTHKPGDGNDRGGRHQKVEQNQQIFKEGWNNFLRASIGQPSADPGVPVRRARLGRHLNILFVLYETIDSNGGLHVQLHAARLMVSGADCLFAVPKAGGQGPKPREADSRVRTFAQVEKDGLTFSDGRGPDIIHAWTPREVVRKFVESIGIKYPCPLVIHLEDNEEYLAEVTVGRPFAELVRLPEQELDSLIPAGCYHPVRGRKFLEQARGLTLIISTLGRFNTANVPSIVLPPPVDERLFYPRPLNRILRGELGIPEDHVVLVYTGNVHAGNREEVRELYRAVQRLNEQGCPATLIRTGINAVNLGSEIWITAHEKPLGWVERNRVPEILAAADFFVQPGAPGPFNDERVPSKLPEYFAMGRPVILPRTNLGLKVEHGRQAWVLDVADAESIAEAVRRLTADRVLRQHLAMGAAAFHRVQSNPSQVAEALLGLYGVESSAALAHADETVMSS